MKIYSNYISQQKINEGFWAWLGSLIKAMFTDDTTEETQEYTKKALKTVEDENPKLSKPTTNLLTNVNKDKPEDFLKKMDDLVKELVNTKIINEDDSIKWQLTVLSIAIRINNDSKKTDVVKLLKKRFDELAKKNPNLAKELIKDIKTEDVPNKPNNDEHNDGHNDGHNGEEQHADYTCEKQLNQYNDTVTKLAKFVELQPEAITKILDKLLNTDDYKTFREEASDKDIFSLCLVYTGLIKFGFNNVDLINTIVEKYTENGK